LLQPIGPAVIGLFRPTILLPKLIVDRMSDSQLRTLIAHEMIHIRRNDLFWALLQMIAGCIWWFHPLVWLANRKLSQESERSCDEETIVCLRCDVGAYARCLIDVLEQKHLLYVAPALPGVRPVQVTERRLERIMKIKHGGFRHNPRWMWLGLMAVSAMIVPGARFSVGQVDDLRFSGKVDQSDRIAETYSVDDLLRSIVSDGFSKEENAQGALLSMLQVYKPTQRPVEADQKSMPRLVATDGIFRIENGMLYAETSSENQLFIKDKIDSHRKHGFKSIVVNVTLLGGIQDLSINDVKWHQIGTSGCAIAILDQQQTEKMHALLSNGQTKMNIHAAPKMIVINGQQARCETHSQRGFSVNTGVNNGFIVVDTGTSLTLTPELRESRFFDLDFKLVHKYLVSENDPSSLRSSEVRTHISLPVGETLVLRRQIENRTATDQQERLFAIVELTVPVLSKTVAASAVISVPSVGPSPIAFDFAFPVAYEDSESRQVFSFTMGLTR